ncbi:hypothetical protein Tco_0315544 [Tanacetum coccineum]
MTRSTVKRLTKPLDEPEREFRRLRRATCRLQHNESLTIAERNLFDEEASTSNNTGVKPPTPPRTLHEHSHPNSASFQNPIILPAEQTGRIIDTRNILLIQGTCTFQGLRNKDPSIMLSTILISWITYKLTEPQGIHLGYASSISSSKEKQQNGLTEPPPPLKSRHGINSCHDSLTTSFRKVDQFAQFCFGSVTEEEGWNRIEEYVQYQDDLWDDMSPPMNVSSISEAMQPTFRGHLKRACNQISNLKTPTREHRKELHEHFSQILSTIRKNETLEPEAPTFSMTTKLGISTQDPPFPTPPQSISANHTEGVTEKEGPEDTEPSIIQEPVPQPFIFYQPSKSSNLPFPSRLKKQKKDEEDERPLSIFK